MTNHGYSVLEELDHLANLNQLWRKLRKFTDLSNRFVGGEGEYTNPIAILIGEAPGAQEEIQGRPFIGPAGQVLRQLMGFAGLYATTQDAADQSQRFVQLGEGVDVNQIGPYIPNCWLTNVVKFRPPRNRTPIPTEIMSVRKLLRQEWLAIGRPSVIIPVGGVALHALYGRRISILAVSGEVREQWSITQPRQRLYICPMIHPSYGIRSGNPRIQEILERDWIKLGRWLRKHEW